MRIRSTSWLIWLASSPVGEGFNEILNNSLTEGAYYEGSNAFPAENCVKIMNPLSTDLNVMRQTLCSVVLRASSTM